MPYSLTAASYYGDILLIEIPVSLMTLACIDDINLSSTNM